MRSVPLVTRVLRLHRWELEAYQDVGQFVNVDKQLTDTSPLKELIRSNVDINALRYGGKGICVALTRLRPAEAMKSIATGESC